MPHTHIMLERLGLQSSDIEHEFWSLEVGSVEPEPYKR